jgi:hypothetical protein
MDGSTRKVTLAQAEHLSPHSRQLFVGPLQAFMRSTSMLWRITRDFNRFVGSICNRPAWLPSAGYFFAQAKRPQKLYYQVVS